MCEWGMTEQMWLTIPAPLSHTGKDELKLVGVDKCIAPMVRALNDAGISTVASCCGHGKQPGRISLRDGRDIFIVPDYDTGQKISRAFTAINDVRDAEISDE